MKNLYQQQNMLAMELNKLTIKDAWKQLKNKDSVSLVLYHFLTKTDVEEAILKSFTPIGETSNKVVKSFMFPHQKQYETITKLFEFLHIYMFKNEELSHMEKILNKNFLINVNTSRIGIKTFMNFMDEIKLTKTQFMKLYALVSSYYLHMVSQEKNFFQRVIKYKRNAHIKRTKILRAKMEELNASTSKDFVQIKKRINQFCQLINKGGNIEKRVMKAYQRRVDRKAVHPYTFKVTRSTNDKKIASLSQYELSRMPPESLYNYYEYETPCFVFNDESIKQASMHYTGLFSALSSLVHGKYNNFFNERIGAVHSSLYNKTYSNILNAICILFLFRNAQETATKKIVDQYVAFYGEE